MTDKNMINIHQKYNTKSSDKLVVTALNYLFES